VVSPHLGSCLNPALHAYLHRLVEPSLPPSPTYACINTLPQALHCAEVDESETADPNKPASYVDLVQPSSHSRLPSAMSTTAKADSRTSACPAQACNQAAAATAQQHLQLTLRTLPYYTLVVAAIDCIKVHALVNVCT